MKRLLITAFLPLLLSQSVAIAQTASPSAIQTPPPAATTEKTATTPQPPPIPLRGTEQLQLQLVNCNPGLDCALATLLLPKSTRIEQLQLQFDNPAAEPAQILNSATVVRGNFTGYQLTDAFSVPSAATLAANQIVSLPLTFKPSEIPPDQYSGAIYLTLANQTNRLTLPINLNVRSGPLSPLLILLIGVVLGRLFKYMQEQGGPQAEARKKLYQLEADLKDAHLDDQKLLTGMVQATRKLVYRQQLEPANTQVTVIRSRLDVLTQLRTIETRLIEQANNNEYVPEEAFEQISQVRVEVEQGLDAKAKETLDQLVQSNLLVCASRTVWGAVSRFDDRRAKHALYRKRRDLWSQTLIRLFRLTALGPQC
jgi:hypothetical protein